MLRKLTADEYLRVQLATRGESYAHRRWPLDVVRAVAAAALVKAGEAHRVETRRAAHPVKTLGSRLRAKLGGRRRGAEGRPATA